MAIRPGGDVSSMKAGQCPLCQSTVPVPSEPRLAGDVIAALGTHFGATCAATAFTTPRPRLD